MQSAHVTLSAVLEVILRRLVDAIRHELRATVDAEERLWCLLW